MTYRLFIPATALAALLTLPGHGGVPTAPAPSDLVLAQTFEGAEDPNFNNDGSRRGESQNNSDQANAATTAFIVGFLDLVRQNCEPLEARYRLGCLTAEVRALSDQMPRRGDYAQAQKAVERAAKELEAITKRARDRRAPAIRAKVTRPNGQRVTSGTITAIKDTSAPKAVQEAEKSIEKVQLTLLRSAPAGDPRASHYQEISKAFDNAAVLLRSL